MVLIKCDLKSRNIGPDHTWAQGVSAFFEYDERLGGRGFKKYEGHFFVRTLSIGLDTLLNY